MKVDNKKHSVIIKDTQGDLTSFLMKVTHQYKTFEKSNMVIDLSFHKNLSINEISQFLPLSEQHRKTRKSFVLVAVDIDYNAIPDELTIVPSLLEANDIIEMEEIERDLGF